LWWVGFAQITFFTLPKSKAAQQNRNGNILTSGFKEFKKVWHEVKLMPLLKRYLFAFFFYSMGVQTVMLAATLFGSQVLNLETSKLLACILIIQIVAIAGAYVMAKF